jgi:hypothetical protein
MLGWWLTTDRSVQPHLTTPVSGDQFPSQIGVAMGQAAIATSTINSSLERRLRPSVTAAQAPDQR